MVSEYIKTLRRAVADENKLLDLLTTASTHVFSEHINQSSEKMLTRLCQQEKNAVSTFTSKADMCFALRSAIMSETQAIEKAVYQGKNFEKIPITFDYDEDEDESFNGFIMNGKGHIEQLKTRSITAVLRTNSNAPLGIELLTVYPNMYADTATKTKQNSINKTVKESNMYAKASTIHKAYFDFILDNQETKVFFDNKETITSEPHIVLEYKHKHKIYQVHIEDSNFSIHAMNQKYEPIYDPINNIHESIGESSSAKIKNGKLAEFLQDNHHMKHDLKTINTYIIAHKNAQQRKTLNICADIDTKQQDCEYE